jgi:hypothetical protein
LMRAMAAVRSPTYRRFKGRGCHLNGQGQGQRGWPVFLPPEI